VLRLLGVRKLQGAEAEGEEDECAEKLASVYTRIFWRRFWLALRRALFPKRVAIRCNHGLWPVMTRHSKIDVHVRHRKLLRPNTILKEFDQNA
jgi:hypothetical protein